jgi:hypothetical protein
MSSSINWYEALTRTATDVCSQHVTLPTFTHSAVSVNPIFIHINHWPFISCSILSENFKQNLCSCYYVRMLKEMVLAIYTFLEGKSHGFYCFSQYFCTAHKTSLLLAEFVQLLLGYSFFMTFIMFQKLSITVIFQTDLCTFLGDDILCIPLSLL